MAGSLQKFGYFFDNDLAPTPLYKGVVLTLDESNQRAIGTVPGPISVGDTPRYIDRFTPRYIYWQGKNAQNEIIRRKIIVCDPSNLFYQQGGALALEIYPGTTIQGFISGAVGEKKTFIPTTGLSIGPIITPRDTGITDGSNP